MIVKDFEDAATSSNPVEGAADVIPLSSSRFSHTTVKQWYKNLSFHLVKIPVLYSRSPCLDEWTYGKEYAGYAG